MVKLRELFLRAKAWQIFVLMVIVPFAVGFLSINSDIKFSVSLMFVCILGFLGWNWAIGSFLNSTVRPPAKLKTGFFHFAVIYPIVYIPVFFFLALHPVVISAALLIPLHLFGMFCMFYLLYFASRSLVSAEKKKVVKSFGDYAGEFMLLWMYPIGIWIVQPRVNRLYEKVRSVESNSPQAQSVM